MPAIYPIILSALLFFLTGTAQSAPPVELANIQQQARTYYDTRGEWAGTFVITRFCAIALWRNPHSASLPIWSMNGPTPRTEAALAPTSAASCSNSATATGN